MLKRVYKGEYGYIAYRKKVGIIRTAICLVFTLALYLTGVIIYHSPKSAFSIIAALGCLPTGWSAVNMIMFMRGKACREEDYKKITACCGDLLIHYDEIITSYDKNFNIAASTVLDKNICCYSWDEDIDITDCEKHIKKMIAANGYSNYSIKIFDDIDKFCERLQSLEKLRSERKLDPKAIEDAWVPGTVQTPASTLLSISL